MSAPIFLPDRPILNKQFIEQAIGKEVKEYSISAGSKPGDNVSGTLLSLTVTDANEGIHNLVVKSVLPIVGDINTDILSWSKVTAASKKYPKEIVYYDRIRPLLEETWKGNKEKADFFVHPKVYTCLHDTASDGLFDYLVMDDLRPQGYIMPDKNKGLTHEEIVETLRRLALLHATSYSILNGAGPLSQKLRAVREDPLTLTNKHCWSMIDGYLGGLFNGIVDRTIELVKESGQEETAKKMQKVAHDGYNKLLMGVWKKTTDNGKYFRVFIHSDLWTNNILIKHGPDGKSVQDVKFIDYQMNHFGNIYEDLHYFIFTSSTANLRKTHLRSYLQVYYGEFEQALKELECAMPDGFCEESFLSTFHETLDFGFVFNLMSIPFQLGLPLSLANSQNLENNSSVNETTANTENTESDKDIPSVQYMQNMKMNELKVAAKNSPIALQRLNEMIQEMFEYGVI